MRRCSFFCKRRSRDNADEDQIGELEVSRENSSKGLENKENTNTCDSISANTMPTGMTWSLSNDSFAKPDLCQLIQGMLWDEVSDILIKYPGEVLRFQPLLLSGDLGEESYSLPLHLACACRAPASVIIKMIQLHPEGLSTTDKKWGKLPLHFACIKCGGVEIIRILLEYFPNAAKVPDYKGCFPIHYASIYGTVEEVSILFNAYPKAIRKKDNLGRTPYQLAKASGNVDKSRIVRFLKNQMIRIYNANKPVKSISTKVNYDEEISVISFPDFSDKSETHMNNCRLESDSKSRQNNNEEKTQHDTDNLPRDQDGFLLPESNVKFNATHNYSDKTVGLEKEMQDITDVPGNISIRNNDDDLSNISLDCYFQKSCDHMEKSGPDSGRKEGDTIVEGEIERLRQESSKALTANFLTRLLESDDDDDDGIKMLDEKLSLISSPLDSVADSCTVEKTSSRTSLSHTEINFGENGAGNVQLELIVANIIDKKVALSKRQKHVYKYNRKLEKIKIDKERNLAFAKSKNNALAEARERVNLLREAKERLDSKIERETVLMHDIEQDIFLRKNKEVSKERKSLVAKKKYNEERYKEISKDVEDLCEQLKSVVSKKPIILPETNESIESILDGCAWPVPA